MAIIKKEKEFEPHPATDDPIRAVVVDVTPFELKDTQFGQKKQCAIVFETEMLKEDGVPYTQWEHGYTESIHEKSNMFKDACAILGVNELGDEFDTECLIGKPVKIAIDHKKDGTKIFANVNYLKKYNGDNPLKPSGKYVRKKDKDKTSTGSSYSKAAPAAGESKEEADDMPDSDAAAASVKIHVGNMKDHKVGDVPLENLNALIEHWIPTLAEKDRLTADDKRLKAALEWVQRKIASHAKQDEDTKASLF